jgi:hypothetical protein
VQHNQIVVYALFGSDNTEFVQRPGLAGQLDHFASPLSWSIWVGDTGSTHDVVGRSFATIHLHAFYTRWRASCLRMGRWALQVRHKGQNLVLGHSRSKTRPPLGEAILVAEGKVALVLGLSACTGIVLVAVAGQHGLLRGGMEVWGRFGSHGVLVSLALAVCLDSREREGRGEE